MQLSGNRNQQITKIEVRRMTNFSIPIKTNPRVVSGVSVKGAADGTCLIQKGYAGHKKSWAGGCQLRVAPDPQVDPRKGRESQKLVNEAGDLRCGTDRTRSGMEARSGATSL